MRIESKNGVGGDSNGFHTQHRYLSEARSSDFYWGQCIISVVVTGIPVSGTGVLISNAAEGIDAMMQQFITAVETGDFSRVLSSTTKALHTTTLPAAVISNIDASFVSADTSVGASSFMSAAPTSTPTVFKPPVKDLPYYEQWSVYSLVGVAGGGVLVIACMLCYLRYRTYSVARIQAAFTSIEAEYLAQLGPVPLISTAGRPIRSHGNGGRGYRAVEPMLEPVVSTKLSERCPGDSMVLSVCAVDAAVALGDSGQPLIMNYIEPDENVVVAGSNGNDGNSDDNDSGSSREGSRNSKSNKNKSSKSSKSSQEADCPVDNNIVVIQPAEFDAKAKANSNAGTAPNVSTITLQVLPDSSSLAAIAGTAVKKKSKKSGSTKTISTSSRTGTSTDAVATSREEWPLSDV